MSVHTDLSENIYVDSNSVNSQQFGVQVQGNRPVEGAGEEPEGVSTTDSIRNYRLEVAGLGLYDNQADLEIGTFGSDRASGSPRTRPTPDLWNPSPQEVPVTDQSPVGAAESFNQSVEANRHSQEIQSEVGQSSSRQWRGKEQAHQESQNYWQDYQWEPSQQWEDPKLSSLEDLLKEMKAEMKDMSTKIATLQLGKSPDELSSTIEASPFQARLSSSAEMTQLRKQVSASGGEPEGRQSLAKVPNLDLPTLQSKEP